MDFFSFFNNITRRTEIAIDLGTANTLILIKGKGIVLNEPSIIAKDTITNKIIAFGYEANEMLGRTHSAIETIRPLKDGVIANLEMTTEMLKSFLNKIKISSFSRPRIVICIPSGVTDLQRRAVKEAAESVNASEVYLIFEPMAAAIGIGIDVSKPQGHMIVDIGGGTTEIAVISLNGTVSLKTINHAGDEQNEAIQYYLRANHDIEIGERTAENIKKRVGSAIEYKDSEKIKVIGKNITHGVPKEVKIFKDEINKALNSSIIQIYNAIKQALDHTPPEHSADILKNGIILTGGGAKLDGLDIYLRNKTKIPVNISEDPLLSIVLGTGIVLDDIKGYLNKGILLNE
jgi:rod shape-determining protein MreB